MRGSTRIVALPGTLCAPAVFDPLAAALTGEAVLDAVSWMTEPGPWDIPSIAERVAARIREAGEGPVVVVGHSTGGAIAQQLVLEHPDLASALVLVDTGPNMRGHGDVDGIIATIRSAWGSDLFARVVDRSFALPLPPERRAELLRYAERVDPRAAEEVLTSQRDLDLVDRLVELDLPVAVVHGVLDPTRTVAQAEAFAAGIPGARLRLVDCGHSPVFERPADVAEVVRALIAAAPAR